MIKSKKKTFSASTVCLVTIFAGQPSKEAMSLLVANPGAAPALEPVAKSGEVVTLTLQPQPGEEIPRLCRRLAAQLFNLSATPLHLQIFGKTCASAATTDALRKFFSRVDWPMTWVEGSACDHRPIAGVQVHAFTGSVERVVSGGRVVGSV